MRFSISMIGKTALCLIIIAAALTGCGSFVPTATPVPTIDRATIIAEAVKTISAQITEEALRNPSPTPQPTNTPVPTATPVPPTPTQLPPTEIPSPTVTTAPALSAKFLSAGTFPENKLVYVPNERFSIAVRFQNAGTVDWPSGSQLMLVDFQGEVTVQKEAIVDRGIAPGEAIEFDLWAFGSETLGKHVFIFQMYTAQGIPVPGGVGVFSYTSE
jgi:hypothetical protein